MRSVVRRLFGSLSTGVAEHAWETSSRRQFASILSSFGHSGRHSVARVSSDDMVPSSDLSTELALKNVITSAHGPGSDDNLLLPSLRGSTSDHEVQKFSIFMAEVEKMNQVVLKLLRPSSGGVSVVEADLDEVCTDESDDNIAE